MTSYSSTTAPDNRTHERTASGLALSRLLDRLRDPELGLIRYIAEIPAQPSEPGIHIAVAEFQDPFALPPRSLNRHSGKAITQSTGAGLDRIGALWATVGEAIERYSLHVYDDASLVYAQANALNGQYLSPHDLVLFSDEQYARTDWPFRRFEPTSTIGWCSGTCLTTGKRAYIPASLTYLGYSCRSLHENLDAAYSTGAAVGGTFAEAALFGLLEVVERDAFACHWYLRHRPSRINRVALLAALPGKLARMLQESDVQIELTSITTDLGIPVVLAMGQLKDRRGFPIGASARLSLNDAAEKAAIEAFHTFNWILELRRSGETPPTRSDLRSYRDHVRYHMEPEHCEHAAFLMDPLADSREVSQAPAETESSRSLGYLVEQLRKRGHQCYAVDITPEELLGLGVCAVKTFITGLHPLGCGFDRAHHDQRRLRSFAKASGIKFPDALNHEPHPFP